MKKNSKVLGKGLNALIAENTTEDKKQKALLELSINDIIPNKEQPRKDMDGIDELSASIKEHGIIQPIVVLKVDGKYQIIAGERRWRASKLAGLEKIPVIIKQSLSAQDKLEIALIENLQRKNLNPIEEAQSYQELMEKFNLDIEYLTKVLGKDRTTITNTIRLLQLPVSIQNDLRSGLIQPGHARPLINLKDEEIVFKIKDKIVKDKISVREIESLVKKYKTKPVPKKKPAKMASHLSDIEERFREKFATKVAITGNDKKGKIMIEYYSQDDFDRILELMDLK